MGRDVEVLDEFLPEDIYEQLDKAIGRQPLHYGSKAHPNGDPHGHWHYDFVNARGPNVDDVAHRLAVGGPLDNAWKYIRDHHLPGNVLIRCYVNGYTYGTDGYFHTDSDRPGEHTVLIYMNDRWEPDWAGETVFLDESRDVMKAVLPRRNRGVIFACDIPHAGRSVSRKYVGVRKVLLFKTRPADGDSEVVPSAD